MRIKQTLSRLLFLLAGERANKYFALKTFRRDFLREPITDWYRATFSDKICLRKIRDRNPLLPLLADKVNVKGYVAQRLGIEFVTPTIWSGRSLTPAILATIRRPFVIKASHGSSWNIFVRSDSDCDFDAIKKKCDLWSSKRYGLVLGEWLYSKIEPQILVEPFISNDGSLPLDYKIFVFNGVAKYVQVDTDRETEHKRCFYDTHWNKQEFGLKFPMDERALNPPVSLREMLAAAESLCEGIDFARVDFYEINSKPVFGEMTFYPGSGGEKFFPPCWDLEFGRLWS
jgi:hypothetical protein